MAGVDPETASVSDASDSVINLAEDISKFTIVSSPSSSTTPSRSTGSGSGEGSPKYLDAISTEFQGILMDLHNSMMSEGGGGGKIMDDEVCPPFDEDGILAPNSNSNSSLDADIAAFATSMKTEAELLMTSGSATLPIVFEEEHKNQISLFSQDVEMGDAKIMGVNFDAPALTVTAPTPPSLSATNGSGSGVQIPGLDLATFGESEDMLKSEKGDVDDAIKNEVVDPESEDIKMKVEHVEGEGEGVEVEEKPPSPGGRIKLHVSKLPTGFNEEHISNLFEPFGSVVQCELFPYKNFAYVHLDNEAGGLQAIKELNKIVINGTKITVMKSRLKSEKPSSSMSTPLEESVGTFKAYISFMFNGVTKEYVTKLVEEFGRVVDIEIYRQNSAFVHMEDEDAGRKMVEELNGRQLPECDRPLQVSESKNPEGPSTPTITLQVKNLPDDVSAYQIRGLFQPYGLVLKCTLTKSKFDLLRKAVVHLEQLGDIRSAMKDLSELELSGKKLIVEHVVEKPSNPEKVPNQEKGSGKSSRGKGRGGHHGPLQPPPMPPFLPEFEYDAPFFRGGGRGGRGMMRGGRGRGGLGFIPPHQYPDMGRVPRDRGMPVCPPFGRGRGGRGRGGFSAPIDAIPRFPKRPYQNYPSFPEEAEGYDFDEYYGDPAAASARDHYANLQSEYEQFQAGVNFNSPPNKRSRGRGGRGGGAVRIGRPIPQQPLPALMPEDFNPFAEDDADYEDLAVPVPYQAHAVSYPSLQLSLGEREYFGGTNGNRGGGGRGKGRGGGGSEQFHAKKQLQQRQQMQQHAVQSFQQKQLMVAAGYPSYLVGEQIPGTSLSNDVSQFGYDYDQAETTAYPANYYQNAAGNSLNAVPFDYSNIKKKNTNQGQRQKYNPQQSKKQFEFPPGVDPKDYQALKPGAKVYLNQAGKVMVRGNRGGRNNKKKPGLGSKPGGGFGGGGGGGTGLSGGNSTPIGGGGGQNQVAGPSSFSFGGGGGGGGGGFKKGNQKYKTKQQVKDDNQEYTDWLASKAWMHQAIPGVVRPVQK